MPGQFKNTGTNPDGKLSLVNNNDAGNATFSIAPPPFYPVTIYGKNQNPYTFGGAGFDIEYSINAGVSWTKFVTNINSTNCDSYGNVQISGVSAMGFRITRNGTSQQVLFDVALNSSVCPSLSTLYCNTVLYYNAPTSIAFTVQVVGGNYVNCP